MLEIPNISKHVKLTPFEGNAVAYIEDGVTLELDDRSFLEILQATTTFEELLLKLSLSGHAFVKDLSDVRSSLVYMLIDKVEPNWTLFNWTSIDAQACIDHAYAILKELTEEIDLCKHFTQTAILEIIADFTHAIDRTYHLDNANKLKALKEALISRMSICFDKKLIKQSIASKAYPE